MRHFQTQQAWPRSARVSRVTFGDPSKVFQKNAALAGEIRKVFGEAPKTAGEAPALPFARFVRYAMICAMALTANLHAANLVQDASFEAGPRVWFEEAGKGDYHLIREIVSDAKDGRFVLAVQGWNQNGSTILSPRISLSGETFSATLDVRLRGEGSQPTVELLLLDEAGKHVLASFGKTQPGTAWSTLGKAGVKLASPAKAGRLGLRVSGAQKGVVLEIDRVGLFAGETLQSVSNNGEALLIEASTLADGKAWQTQSSDGGTMYFDPAFNETVLVGSDALKSAESGEVIKTISIRQGGDYRLWVRFLQTANFPGAFTMALRQNGKVIAEKTIEVSEKGKRTPWKWHWESVSAHLQPGQAELVLKRPAQGASSLSRRLDRFFLTNITDYEVKDVDFRQPVWMRFTNRSEETGAFCFWVFVHRHTGPLWYATPGMLSQGGFSQGYALPSDLEKWIAPGESSPWVRISDYLLPAGGRNNVQMIATRASHTEGFVEGRIRGDLEFAVGNEQRIVKTVPVDQEAPRILFTIPAEVKDGETDIQLGHDYVARGEATLPVAETGAEEPSKNIEVSGHLSLKEGMDDPVLLGRELHLMRRLGMQNTYHLFTTPEKAKARNKELGLFPAFAVTDLASLQTLSTKGEAVLEEAVQKHAEKMGPILQDIHRIMMADEPTAPKYETLTQQPEWKIKFQDWLREQNITPEMLGVDSWEAVTPVGPDAKEKQPELFYYTGLFRLHAMADLSKQAATVYRKHFPPSALTTVNLSPYVFSGISDEGGHDEYFLFRDEGKYPGLDLMWTEDWPGYGASLQQLSSYLAMLRVAGRPGNKPLGGFLVPYAQPEALRIQAYTWLSEGVRMLNFYSYGPWYAGIDSWSTRYGIYPEMAEIGREIRRLDPALEGMKRRPAQIAIVYNRTAGIWRDFAVNTEQDARYIHWALAHAGYDADIIPEEDIEAGKIANYRLIYLNGVQLRRETAEKLAQWVHEGGTLVGTAGAGTRDTFNRPLETLTAVFGAKSGRLQNVNSAGRARYETRKLPDLGQAQSQGDAPPVSFRTLGIREKLTALPGASVILQRSEAPAGVMNAWGQGRAIRLAALPGLAYLQEAVGEKEVPATMLPDGYQGELRDFIAWPAKLAGVEPVALEKNAPLAAVTRWDHPKRSILYIINYSGQPIPDFSLKIPDAVGFTKARTLRGKPVTLHPSAIPDALEIRFALDVADAVILEHE